MATRIYLTHATAYAAAISPPHRPGWTNTTSVSYRVGTPRKLTGDSASTLTQSWTAGEVRLSRVIVIGPLKGGQEISGTITAWGRAWESAADDNATTRFSAHVVASDGATTQAVLLDVGHYGTGLEYAVSSPGQNRQFADDAIPSYTTEAGDYIVCGFGHADAAGTTPQASWVVGSDFGTDTSESEAAVNGIPWVEFSTDLQFLTGAKLGTRFLGRAFVNGANGYTQLAVDDSQDDTDMTATATSITEDPAARYDQSHPRTIAWRATQTNTSTGVIYAQSDGVGGQVQHIDTLSGAIRAFRSGVSLASLSLPGVSASSQSFLCAWISIANPDTTGASDAVLSWLVARNLATGAVARQRFTHAAKPASTERVSWGDRDGAGTNPFTGTLTMVGFHDRRMTLSELVNDFVSVTEEPSTEFVEDRMPLPFDIAMGLHSMDELHGPAAAWAARNHQQLRRRLATTMQVRYTTMPEFQVLGGTQPAPSKMRLAVGSAAYQWYLGWLHVWPVPAGCNEAWVQLHLTQTEATEVGLTAVGLRVYSMNRPPGNIGGLQPGPGEAEAFEQYYAERVLAAGEIDSSQLAAGLPVEIGRLPIARATTGIRAGKTYLAVAFAIDPAGAGDPGQAEEQRIQIGHVHVVPGFREPEDGGIGFGGFGG
jgi:hypothetical protein